MKNLVIVESPAKAKTIEKYLGKDFKVESSFGHIRDLPKSGMNIDIESGTFEPTYEVNDDKKKRVRELKKLVKGCEMVWLATDRDREGEAIAWHLAEALKLKDANTKRITFDEITKPAVTTAIKNPRKIDKPLVDAQQARRVLDRLVGYELSPVLWKKIKAGLSAGRVQSVAVRIVVERERQITGHKPTKSWRTVAVFESNGKKFTAELNEKFKSKDKAEAFLQKCINATFTVGDVTEKPAKKSPAAPFTTSTLQQEASRKLSFSVKKTMMVAQRLYEAGKITYMRTDSVNLSDTAIESAKNAIVNKYGASFFKKRAYKNKSKDAQEAHEAIRPTDFSLEIAGAERDQERLYDLIRKRAMASQMADAQLLRTNVKIEISDQKPHFKAKGEVITFAGFMEVYLEGTDDENDEQSGLLPKMTVGQALDYQKMESTERFSRPPARFTEASLVKKLEEEGIGRPSTYAPTISTILYRNYVSQEEKEGVKREYGHFVLQKDEDGPSFTEKTEKTGATTRRHLWPTDIGKVVSDFLVKHFANVVDYGFTRKVEEEFDEIAAGKAKWNEVIKNFYTPFHKKVEDSAGIDRADAVAERLLGIDPKSGLNIIARLGRYGPLVQKGKNNEETGEKATFASLLKHQSLDEVTLEDALELFKLPRNLGEHEGEKVRANIGRFGPYVQVGKTFVSLKEDSPYEIELPKAIELYKIKKEADAKKIVKDFGKINKENTKLQRGPYGIYIKYGKRNVKIPKEFKDKEESLTEAQVAEIIEKAPAKKTFKRKTTKKTTKKAK